MAGRVNYLTEPPPENPELVNKYEFPFSIEWFETDGFTRIFIAPRDDTRTSMETVWTDAMGASATKELYINANTNIDDKYAGIGDIYVWSPIQVRQSDGSFASMPDPILIYKHLRNWWNPTLGTWSPQTAFSLDNNGVADFGYNGADVYTRIQGEYPNVWPDARDARGPWFQLQRGTPCIYIYGKLVAVSYIKDSEDRHYVGLFQHNDTEDWHKGAWSYIHSFDIGVSVSNSTGHIRFLAYREVTSDQQAQAEANEAGLSNWQEVKGGESGRAVLLNTFSPGGRGYISKGASLNEWEALTAEPDQTIDFRTIINFQDPYPLQQLSEELRFPGTGSVDGSALWKIDISDWATTGDGMGGIVSAGFPKWVKDYDLFVGMYPAPQQGGTRWRKAFVGSTLEWDGWGTWESVGSAIRPVPHIGLHSDGLGELDFDTVDFREVRLFCFSIFDGLWDIVNYGYVSIDEADGAGEMNGLMRIIRLSWPKQQKEEGDIVPSLIMFADCSIHNALTSPPQSDVAYLINLLSDGCRWRNANYDNSIGLYVAEFDPDGGEINLLKHRRTDYWQGPDLAQRSFQVSYIDERVYMGRPFISPGGSMVAGYIPTYEEPGVFTWLALIEDRTDDIDGENPIFLDITHGI